MKQILLAVGLLLTAGTAQAQFPNNYASNMTVTYDPAHGTVDPAVGKTPGTITVTIQFSGATQNQAMNNSGVHHTPHASAKIGNWTQTMVGPGFLPASQMTWSHPFSFDLEAAGCDFQVLDAGTCEVDNVSFVTCPTMGLIAIPWQKIQFEIANSTSNLNPSTRYWNGTTHVYSPTSGCSNQGDFPGPDVAFGNEPFGSTIDTFSASFIRTQDLGWRLAAWGTEFTGLPWQWLNLPRTIIGGTATPYLQMAIANGIGLCTRKDPPSASPAFNF